DVDVASPTDRASATRCVRQANRPSGGRWQMPTTRQHPCRAAPPEPRRSRRWRYPSGKGLAAASRSISAAHVGRQDRRREPDAVGVGSVRLAIAYTRLAHGDRTDTGHHLAFRQVTVAHDALVAVRSLQIGMLADKVRDLGLDRLGQQSTRSNTQDFGELIVDVSWLNQLDDVISGHGISLLRWRSGAVKPPQDLPPSRSPPSPTFSDSSQPWSLAC